jgi:two-component system chemotaxis sensor kinase CheA
MPSQEDIELKKAFFIESMEILEKLDSDINAMEKKPNDTEVVNTVFRGLHTIKGNSSFLSLDKITKISHSAETLLDKARKKELPVNADLMRLVRRVFSDLKLMIGEQETELDVSVPIDAIQKYMAGDKSALAKLGDAPQAPAAAAAGGAAKIQTGGYVRVDEAKVGKILALASELELLRYGLEKMPEKMDRLGPVAADIRFDLEMQVSKLSRITKSLSGIIFGVRLVPVNQVFQRFPRVVQELAQKLGKQMRLEILNGDAELDKAIVEAIADPMTHLIRNSADHGIEDTAARKASGKAPAGTIKLNSFLKGNFVFIEISDDGKGIDGDKILQKAVEKGIVPADKAPTFTESQKLALIFAPGFSTAEKVTDISGRGVGMDVVKSNINKLKGTVIIDSKVGKGTVIQLRFPMSMVVLFSLFVEINNTICAFPMDQIDESIDFSPNELLDHIPEGEDPKKFFALYSLKEMLWKQSENLDGRRHLHALRFKEVNGKQTAFIVDDFTSIEEAIVQSVDSYIAALPGIQGASMRKDGSVALVLNTQNLVELAIKAKPFAYARMKDKTVVEDASLSDFLNFAGSA